MYIGLYVIERFSSLAPCKRYHKRAIKLRVLPNWGFFRYFSWNHNILWSKKMSCIQKEHMFVIVWWNAQNDKMPKYDILPKVKMPLWHLVQVWQNAQGVKMPKRHYTHDDNMSKKHFAQGEKMPKLSYA